MYHSKNVPKQNFWENENLSHKKTVPKRNTSCRLWAMKLLQITDLTWAVPTFYLWRKRRYRLFEDIILPWPGCSNRSANNPVQSLVCTGLVSVRSGHPFPWVRSSFLPCNQKSLWNQTVSLFRQWQNWFLIGRWVHWNIQGRKNLYFLQATCPTLCHSGNNQLDLWKTFWNLNFWLRNRFAVPVHRALVLRRSW